MGFKYIFIQVIKLGGGAYVGLTPIIELIAASPNFGNCVFIHVRDAVKMEIAKTPEDINILLNMILLFL
jgi:hypothetical protein